MTINNYLKKGLFFLLSLLSLVSCQKQPVVRFGTDYLGDNSSANIVVVDTSTVAVSTVFVDSTASAGTGYLQVGRYADPYFGTISSRAFIQLGNPGNAPAITVFDKYDSISLIMLYKKGNPFYGDSTRPISIEVHQVDTLYEQASFQHGFFSNSSLPIDPAVLGSITTIIAPNIPYTGQGVADSLKIKLDDALGSTLYNMIYNKSDSITKSVNFLKWFHGLCITPGAGSEGAIFGFQDSAVMRIYYHEASAYANTKFIDFGITNKSYQFNNIRIDRSASALAKLNLPSQTVQTPPSTSSDSTGHTGFLQTATGLDVKMTFPYLSSIALRSDYLNVLRAQLTVKPVPGSWGTTYPLPPQLTIYSTDHSNTAIAPLINSSTGGTQTGSLSLNYLQPTETAYTYDVTNFVKQQITNRAAGSQDNGILLAAPSPNSENSFARVLLSDATYPVSQRVTLSVYYIALFPHQ